MDGWSGVVWLEGRAGGRGRRGVGVGCVGMGGVCVCGRGGRRKEGGEEATDSIEHQNSHKQSLFFWLGSSLSQNQKSVLDFALCTDTETILSSAISRVKGECHPGTYHRDAWLVIFELTILISAWRWCKARGATWIWWP